MLRAASRKWLNMDRFSFWQVDLDLASVNQGKRAEKFSIKFVLLKYTYVVWHFSWSDIQKSEQVDVFVLLF